jgi:hypothetical protein
MGDGQRRRCVVAQVVAERGEDALARTGTEPGPKHACQGAAGMDELAVSGGALSGRRRQAPGPPPVDDLPDAAGDDVAGFAGPEQDLAKDVARDRPARADEIALLLLPVANGVPCC